MSRLSTWISRQNPAIAKSMTVVKDVDFLHISTNPGLRTMVPRIGERQMVSEDRSIPRICGSETLKGCIYGHAAVLYDILDRMTSDGKQRTDIDVPIYTVYRLNVEEVVRPTKKLVRDVVNSKELWVVPYSPEACSAKAEKVGTLLPVKTTTDIKFGNVEHTSLFYFEVKLPYTLEDELFDLGYYAFSLNGSMSCTMGEKAEKVSNVHPINKKTWDEAIKLAKEGISKM